MGVWGPAPRKIIMFQKLQDWILDAVTILMKQFLKIKHQAAVLQVLLTVLLEYLNLFFQVLQVTAYV